MSSKSILVQATAVAIEGRALMIEGQPGSGKSSLALALLDRGAKLIGDDGIKLTMQGGLLIASPPPNIAGKLEIRNVGIVQLPCVSAPLALILSLTPNAARYPDQLPTRTLLDGHIPTLAFCPGDATQALRAEWALRVHATRLPE